MENPYDRRLDLYEMMNGGKSYQHKKRGVLTTEVTDVIVTARAVRFTPVDESERFDMGGGGGFAQMQIEKTKLNEDFLTYGAGGDIRALVGPKPDLHDHHAKFFGSLVLGDARSSHAAPQT
jgi:hypothetical protein